MLDDGSAFHEFHGQKWLALCTDPGIVETRNVRVRQGGQNVAFAYKALCITGLVPVYERKLECDAAPDTVAALSEPDGTHSACADLPHEPITRYHCSVLM